MKLIIACFIVSMASFLYADQMNANQMTSEMEKWKNNPDLVKIKEKICNKDTKPTETQWTAIMECRKGDQQNNFDIETYESMVSINVFFIIWHFISRNICIEP